MFRRSLRRDFFYTWQCEGFERVAQKYGYSSPIWIEQSDVNWVMKNICPLKGSSSVEQQQSESDGASREKMHAVNKIPIRLQLFNMNQLDVNAPWVNPPITEDCCPPGTSKHTSFSTKREYDGQMQFQLEQRAFSAGLMPTEEEKEAQELEAVQEGFKGRLPFEYFWMTPFEANRRRLKVRRELSGQNKSPFAIMSTGRKNVHSADQFVDPKLFEKFPINASTGRPFSSHQHAAMTAWHDAYLETELTSETEKQEYYNRLCLFASRKDLEEMGLALKKDASSVKVPVRSNNTYNSDGTKVQESADGNKKDNSEFTTPEDPAAFGAALEQPRDSDVVHYSKIINQDKLWENSRIVRPTAATDLNSESTLSSQAATMRPHTIIPQGFTCFMNMRARLDEHLAKNPEMNGEKLWVTRKRVRDSGLQLVEGAEFVRAPLKGEATSAPNREQQESTSSMLELFHISQCEDPARALKCVGLHTR